MSHPALRPRPDSRPLYAWAKNLGEPAPARVECRHAGDQCEDWFKHCPRVAGAITASAD